MNLLKKGEEKEMKSKTNFKFLLVLAVIIGAMLLLGTTKVQASSQENVEVELVDKTNTLIDNITAELYKYDEAVDGKNGSITIQTNNYTAKFKEIQQYLKNNNLKTFNPKIYINIPDNVKIVKDIKTNKEYNILDRNGKKYIEYNIEIAKVFNDFSEIYPYYNGNTSNRTNLLQYITEDNQTAVYSIDYGYYDYDLYYDDVVGSNCLEFGSYISDESGKVNVDKYLINDVAYAMSYYWHTVGRGGFDETIAPAQTNFNYINDYIYISIPYNVGQNLTAKIKGTTNTIEFNYFNLGDLDTYLYRAKITKDIENLIFNKAQTVTITYTTHHKNLNLPYTFEFPISVAGSTRTKLTINNDEDVKIDFNGILPMGVTIKAEEIKDNTELYATLSTTGIADMGKYYNKNSLTHLLLTDITTVGGNIDGAIQLTFNVGEQYNGKYVYIAHKRHNGNYEYFSEIVKNGSITIVVDELSPFIVAVEEKINKPTNQETNKPTDTTDKGEKDETPTTNTISKEKDDTPKTGTETINIIGYVLATTILSGAGIVALKKNLK